jgi:hypothetical protein
VSFLIKGYELSGPDIQHAINQDAILTDEWGAIKIDARCRSNNKKATLSVAFKLKGEMFIQRPSL